MLCAGVARAQAPDFSKVEIKANKVTDKFYTLDGQGGTIGVLFGPDGVFMVDTQFAPLSDKIAAAIKQITPQPIKFVVNTHVHGDHTGGDENFGKMGATIISREELRFRLAHPNPAANGQPGVPMPAAGLPEADLHRQADAPHGRRGDPADRHPARAHRRRHDGLFPGARRHHDRRLLPLDPVSERGSRQRRIAAGPHRWTGLGHRARRPQHEDHSGSWADGRPRCGGRPSRHGACRARPRGEAGRSRAGPRTTWWPPR